MANHACPGRCGAQVPFHQLACKPCWFRLPRPYRDAVNTAYRHRFMNPAAHREAVDAAMRWYGDHATPPDGDSNEGSGNG